MTRDELRAKVIGALTGVAPEMEPSALDARRPLRDQVEIDSMDFLRFALELHRQFGVEVPEADYPRLTSLDAIVDYLSARLGAV